MKKSNVLLSLFCSFGLMNSCLELNAADSAAVAVDQSDPSAGVPNHKKKRARHKKSPEAKARHSAKRAAKKKRHQHPSGAQDAAADPNAAGN